MSDHRNDIDDALDRMRRAAQRGTGCHLTADMIAGLALTFLAETWGEPRATLAQKVTQNG